MALKDIDEAYAISDDGRVWSRKTSRWLKPADNGKGYLFVHLYNGGQSTRHYIHRLVAQAYLENPDNLPQVNHKDGDKQNNSLQNLEWCDIKQNMRHAWDNGLCLVWDKQVASVKKYNRTKRKLTDDQVLRVKALYNDGNSMRFIAREYGIHNGTVSQIINGKSYKDVA